MKLEDWKELLGMGLFMLRKCLDCFLLLEALLAQPSILLLLKFQQGCIDWLLCHKPKLIVIHCGVY